MFFLPVLENLTDNIEIVTELICLLNHRLEHVTIVYMVALEINKVKSGIYFRVALKYAPSITSGLTSGQVENLFEIRDSTC